MVYARRGEKDHHSEWTGVIHGVSSRRRSGASKEESWTVNWHKWRRIRHGLVVASSPFMTVFCDEVSILMVLFIGSNGPKWRCCWSCKNGHCLESWLNRYVGYSTGEKEGKEDECFIERTCLKKKLKFLRGICSGPKNSCVCSMLVCGIGQLDGLDRFCWFCEEVCTGAGV